MATETHHGMQSKGGDWQDHLYQKIQVMKRNHLSALTEMHKKISMEQNHPQQQQLEFDKLAISKNLLERVISFLIDSKQQQTFSLDDVDKFVSYEERMVEFITSNTQLEPVSWSLPCNWLETEERRLIF